MRLKRMCEAKSGGRLQVDQSVHQQWLEGNRDQLSLALVRALKENGLETTSKVRAKVKACEIQTGDFNISNIVLE